MGILQNEQVQAALIAVIVVGLNALAQWVRSKVSYTKLIDDNWCYIQPLRDAAIAQALEAVKGGTWGSAAMRDIATRTLAGLADVYRKNEDREPSVSLLAAAADEIEQAMQKAVAK